MFWRNREESSNVETRSGIGRGGLMLGGGGGLILLVLSVFFGVDLTQLGGVLTSVPQGDSSARNETALTPEQQEQTSFTKVVLRDTEIVWGEEFARRGLKYREPKLVIYTGVVQSACGNASNAVGPFYCPSDEKVYLDLSFYRDMERKLKAGGDFARAYVIAHEIGHHVQNQLGYMRHVEAARRSGSKRRANQASVQLELQADFLAGVWANRAQKKFQFLEPNDIDEALNAAFQVGDDRLQQRATGQVVPDSFTHGTSRQRESAFREGFQTGDLALAAKFFPGSQSGRP